MHNSWSRISPWFRYSSYIKAHEGNLFMMLPLIVLAVFSIFLGYITKDIFIGLGSGFFADKITRA
jgi:NADH:ubiquinone oxidoreductase subunit 5 (subunit L)/multisubunit Na+/H+ antiporter MnhA subunit